MKVNMYCIYDKGVKSYTFPFAAHNDYAALRIFERACVDPDSMISIKPSDFDLYRVSCFDDSTGELTPEIPCFIQHGLAAYQSSVEYRDGKPVPVFNESTPKLSEVVDD